MRGIGSSSGGKFRKLQHTHSSVNLIKTDTASMKLEENYLDVRMTDHDVYQNVDSMNIQDLYQELCANNAEAMMKAQSEGVRDNRELIIIIIIIII